MKTFFLLCIFLLVMQLNGTQIKCNGGLSRVLSNGNIPVIDCDEFATVCTQSCKNILLAANPKGYSKECIKKVPSIFLQIPTQEIYQKRCGANFHFLKVLKNQRRSFVSLKRLDLYTNIKKGLSKNFKSILMLKKQCNALEKKKKTNKKTNKGNTLFGSFRRRFVNPLKRVRRFIRRTKKNLDKQLKDGVKKVKDFNKKMQEQINKLMTKLNNLLIQFLSDADKAKKYVKDLVAKITAEFIKTKLPKNEKCDCSKFKNLFPKQKTKYVIDICMRSLKNRCQRIVNKNDCLISGTVLKDGQENLIKNKFCRCKRGKSEIYSWTKGSRPQFRKEK